LIVEISKDLLISNPYNPKHAFSKEERAFLSNSLVKWGLQRTFTVVKDYQENSNKYIILDGNDCSKLVNNDKVTCWLIEDVKTEKQLKEITLDLYTSVKKLNRGTLQLLYNGIEEKNKIYDDIYAKLKVRKEEINNQIEKSAENKVFNKFVVLKFTDESAYLQYENIVKHVKRKIKENDKLFTILEEMNSKINIDIVEKYLFEILFVGEFGYNEKDKK
jgi:3-deoxy-D-manno-octulosonate 8-phosphate phosphatase KdsC-like HAD superfamily phosphatase